MTEKAPNILEYKNQLSKFQESRSSMIKIAAVGSGKVKITMENKPTHSEAKGLFERLVK